MRIFFIILYLFWISFVMVLTRHFLQNYYPTFYTLFRIHPYIPLIIIINYINPSLQQITHHFIDPSACTLILHSHPFNIHFFYTCLYLFLSYIRIHYSHHSLYHHHYSYIKYISYFHPFIKISFISFG